MIKKEIAHVRKMAEYAEEQVSQKLLNLRQVSHKNMQVKKMKLKIEVSL